MENILYLPTYRLLVPPQAVGANKVHLDLFAASPYSLILLKVTGYMNLDATVTGALAVRLYLTRTTDVGTGGTAATTEGTALNAATISRFNPSDEVCPSGITARAAPAGGATAGAWLGEWDLAPEESNTSMGYQSLLMDVTLPHRKETPPFVVNMGTGVRILQGAVASVGTIGFMVDFAIAQGYRR